MITLKNSDVYVGGLQFNQTRAGGAIADLFAQRVGREVGMKLRSLKRALQQQADDVMEEHKRIFERMGYEEGEELRDGDQEAANREYVALLSDEFTIDHAPIKLSSLGSVSLLGSTWDSPLIEDEPEKPAKKKEPAEETPGE